MKNNISRQEYIVAVLFIVIVVFFYLMNVDIPFFSDDDSCMYLFGHRISTAKDLFNAIVFDYKVSMDVYYVMLRSSYLL